jgi:hypothetical protein
LPNGVTFAAELTSLTIGPVLSVVGPGVAGVLLKKLEERTTADMEVALEQVCRVVAARLRPQNAEGLPGSHARCSPRKDKPRRFHDDRANRAQRALFRKIGIAQAKCRPRESGLACKNARQVRNIHRRPAFSGKWRELKSRRPLDWGNRPTLCDDGLCFVSIHNSSAQSDVHGLVAGITHML